MTKEQKILLKLIKKYITDSSDEINIPEDLKWDFLVNMADKHAVLPFLYDYIAENEVISERIKERTEISAVKTVLQSYRLLFMCKSFCEALEEAGVPVLLLKGVGTASYYKVPELRKTGDVDLLLLEPDKLGKAIEIIESMNCEKESVQSSLHHVAFRTKEGIEIELHTMLAEPFDNSKTNQYIYSLLTECAENKKYQDVMGVTLPILDDGFHSYELLLHMLQHFLRSGFGLKLLCDWVVFWNREVAAEEKDKYMRLIQESGIKGFSDMITLVCIDYLGLKKENVEFMNLPSHLKTNSFLEEIFEAEEFGKSSKDRMVTLRGNSIWDFIREFHHQMQLSFPNAGKIFICWPVLWVITLVRFLRNNRIIRKTSTYSILKKTFNRSKMMKQIKLFK